MKMGKEIGFICFMLSILLMTLPALAQDEVQVILSTTAITINTSETKYVDVVIKNNQDFQDSFSVSVWPSVTWSGVSPNLDRYSVSIDANSDATVELYLTVASDAEEVVPTFLITARSLTNSSIVDSESINVRIVRKTSVYISDIKLDKYVLDPGESITIDVSLTNLAATEAKQLKLQTSIKTPVEIIRRFDDQIASMEKKSTKTLSHGYSFDKYAAPTSYSVEATLRDSLNRLIDSRSVNFKVNRISNIIHQKSVSYGLFSQTATIKVRNEGNVLEEDFYVSETIPEFIKDFFFPQIEPDKVEVKDKRVVYSWLVPSLLPGDEVTIKYEIKVLSLWLVGLVIIGVVALAFKYVYMPKIIKKHKRVEAIERGKEILISLEVRNPTLREIKDVVVKDLVSPIAKVVERFDTMRPTVKATEAGTELIWKLKSLRPLEERILTYRIKPVVELIGTLRLPKATISYVDRKKKKKETASKTIIIKPK